MNAYRKHTTIGTKRLWDAIQQVPTTPHEHDGITKKQQVTNMLARPNGASLEEIMTATGWQAHSVRGFISTQKKDYDIERFTRDDTTDAYRRTTTNDN